MKFTFTALLFFCVNVAFCSETFYLKNIPIVYNLDSLEHEIAKCSKTDDENYLKNLFSLEYSRFFFSSAKYGDNFDDIKKQITKPSNKNFVPYYNLFGVIKNFSRRENLDTTLSLLYLCKQSFLDKKDTLALILTYSRLIDIQLIYRDKKIH